MQNYNGCNSFIGEQNYNGLISPQISHCIDYGQYNAYTNQSNDYQRLLANQMNAAVAFTQSQQHEVHMDGHKPIVVCGTVIENCDDLDKAQKRAEELAHKLGANAYILKPVRMVAPKRDVVTTEL